MHVLHPWHTYQVSEADLAIVFGETNTGQRSYIQGSFFTEELSTMSAQMERLREASNSGRRFVMYPNPFMPPTEEETETS